jgi:hypothetical protein
LTALFKAAKATARNEVDAGGVGGVVCIQPYGGGGGGDSGFHLVVFLYSSVTFIICGYLYS